MKLIIALSILVVMVCAKPQYQQVQYQQQGGPSEPYDFNYKVENPQTNTFFGQNENGDQNGNKIGSYYVLLPDGRTMTVNYVADGQGYSPKISFSGGGAPIRG